MMVTKSGEHPVVHQSKYRSGWYSTKLHFALIGCVILTAVFLSVVIITGSAAGFGEYCMAMVTLVGTYSGSRVAETFAQSTRKANPPPTLPPSDPGGS